MYHRAKSVIAVAAMVVALAACGGGSPSAPMAGVQLKLLKAGATSGSSKMTDAEGKVDFGVLKKGGYTITPTLPVKPLAAGADTTKPRNAKATVVLALGKSTVTKQITAAVNPPTLSSVEVARINFQSDGVTPVIITVKSP